MHRTTGFLVLIWLATSAAAQAQVVPQGTVPNGKISGTSASAAGTKASPGSSATGDTTTVNGASFPGTPCSSVGGSFIGSLSMALGCDAGPSGVSSSNAASSNASASFTAAPAAGSTTTSGSGSAGTASGISASASVNPQAAVQLPGEAPNASTQGARSTASNAGAGLARRRPSPALLQSLWQPARPQAQASCSARHRSADVRNSPYRIELVDSWRLPWTA